MPTLALLFSSLCKRWVTAVGVRRSIQGGDFPRCAPQYRRSACTFAPILTLQSLYVCKESCVFHSRGSRAREPTSPRRIASLSHNRGFSTRGGAPGTPPPQYMLIPLAWTWLLVTPVGIDSRRAGLRLYRRFRRRPLLLSRCRPSSASSGRCCTRLGCPRGSGPATTWRC